MTGTSTRDLESLLARVDLLMLDFDGPICSVFAGLTAPMVADRLRASLETLGVDVAGFKQDDDPLSIYRRTVAFDPSITAKVNATLTAAEIEAIASASPTPGALDVIKSARQAGCRIAIVSNNAAAAIDIYLREHGLTTKVDYVAGRCAPVPRLMKPSPDYLIEASTALQTHPDRAIMVGDSVSDVEAAKHAGMPAIGYANKTGKADALRTAGASATVDHMARLAYAFELLITDASSRPSTDDF